MALHPSRFFADAYPTLVCCFDCGTLSLPYVFAFKNGLKGVANTILT